LVRQFGDPDVMKVEETADPRPGAGEVAVRLRAAGVNPVDTYVRSGDYRDLPELPFTPGGDGAGEVIEVGSGVSDVKTGDRVWVSGAQRRFGTYAQITVVPRERVANLPDALSFEQGAAVGAPYQTAYRALVDK